MFSSYMSVIKKEYTIYARVSTYMDGVYIVYIIIKRGSSSFTHPRAFDFRPPIQDIFLHKSIPERPLTLHNGSSASCWEKDIKSRRES